MTVVTRARPRRSSLVRRQLQADLHAEESRSRLRLVCSIALMLGAGVHLNLGIAHAGSNFATLSLFASAAQASLGAAVALRGEIGVANAVVLLELVLAQLYLMSVTVGLPPVIAHVHTGGEHVVWGLTLAVPGPADVEGVFSFLTEMGGALSAAALVRSHPANRRA